MPYNWKYIISGRKIKKIAFVVCDGDKEVSRVKGINYAIRYQLENPDAFENDIRDYALNEKAAIEARWDNKKHVDKIQLIPDTEWRKTQKDLEKKDKQKKTKQKKF